VKNDLTIFRYSTMLTLTRNGISTFAEIGPSGYYVVALSEFFGVSTDWLLGMSEERSRTAT
jgi:hypothetical protein